MKKLLFFLLLSITSLAQTNYQKDWSTYYLGNRSRAGMSTVDHEGNIIVIGAIYISEDLSYYNSFTTAGCFQPEVAGGIINGNSNEIFIAKFSPTGTLLWATYYGGTGDDANSGIAIDSLNNIYLVGQTSSTSGIATNGSFLDSYPTTVPITGTIGFGFIAKFSSSGVRQWGTYFQGNIDAVYVDSNDQMYIGGVTTSATNISTPGSFSETLDAFTYGNGYDYTNLFINKFDANGNRLLGTYFGRANFFSSRMNITSDSLNRLIISGTVYNDYLNVLPSSGSHQTSYGGGAVDGFLAKFSSSLDQRFWSTFYGGSKNDYVRKAVTFGNDIYLVGTTNSNNNIATSGSYQPIKSGSNFDAYNIFISKFNENGVRQWGTYYGGNEGNIFSDVAIHNNGLYIVGSTTSTDLGTSGVYQENFIPTYTIGTSTPVLNSELVFAMFSLDGIRNWCSYYNGVNSSAGISFSDFDGFYITGTTLATTGISTPGSLQPNLDFGANGTIANHATNMFISRFDATPLATNSFATTSLQLLPNPSNGNFVLQGNTTNFSSNMALVIYDNLGREIASQDVKSGQNISNQEFNFGNILSQGIYFAKLTDGNQVLQTFKVLVK